MADDTRRNPDGEGDGAAMLAAFRAAAFSLPGYLWTAGSDGRVNWMCDSLRACLAGGGEAGEDWGELVHPADRQRITRLWAEALAKGGIYEAECRMRSASGEYFWHLIHATALHEPGGGIAGWIGSNVNIHVHKLAEREAGRARSRIWALSRVFMLIFDNEWKIRQANPALQRAMGWRPGEIEGRDLLSFVHPEDAERARETLQRIARKEVVEGFECRVSTRSGAYRVMDWEIVPDGGLNQAVGRDLTEQHEARRELERTWALSPVLKFVLRPDGGIVTVSPAWSKSLGWSEPETLGRSVYEFIAAKDVPAMRARLRQEQGPAATLDLTMLTRQGEERDITWTSIFDGGLLYGFGRDVTAERRAAAAAAAASAERERVWTSTNDLMTTMELDGRLRAVNPAWTRLLGHAESDLLGARALSFVVPEDRGRVMAAIRALGQGEPMRNLECRMIDQAGRRPLISWSADPQDGYIYMVGRDVSAQREAEEQLRQAQKMEAVGQLTGGIAHDFNNLLQGIKGSLELLGKRLARGETSGLERFISIAAEAADRAAALTHRLLAFSRRQPLNPKPVEVNPHIASIEMLLRRTLGEHSKLRLELQEDLWRVLCDPNQLENALLNLAINARDAMPEGGRLSIRTGNATFGKAAPGGLAPGEYVCIDVADTGVGMDADTLAKVFEPFFTTKPVGLGTGLGLSMIYGFARQSNGHVEIDSAPGRGATVRLYLPRHDGEPEDELAEEEEAAAHDETPGSETVLVVEDEPLVRGLIVEMLAGLGYTALEAAGGPAGLEILQSRQRIDLLITDVGLPGLNGRQIAEAARLRRPGLKILFITGYAETVVIGEGRLEPGMDLMPKPFTMEALAARVRQILAGRA